MPLPDAIGRFEQVLRFAIERSITDVHIKVGQRPLYNRAGNLITRKEESPFIDGELAEISKTLFSPNQAKAFSLGAEVTCTHSVVGTGRFRIQIYRQRQSIALSVRVLHSRVPTLRDLRLPQSLGALSMAQSGLVLISSSMGHGRSSTLAAMVETINTASQQARRVVSIERPIELLFDDKMAWISQREVGVDTSSVETGLQGVMRQGFDVVVVQDIESAEVMDQCMGLAEVGVLVLASVPAGDVTKAFRRLYCLFDDDRMSASRRRLAGVLLGASSQRLVPCTDGQKRVPAVEILLASDEVKATIRNNVEPSGLYEIMAKGLQGMQTIDLALMELVKSGAVSPDVAMYHAMRPDLLAAK